VWETAARPPPSTRGIRAPGWVGGRASGAHRSRGGLTVDDGRRAARASDRSEDDAPGSGSPIRGRSNACPRRRAGVGRRRVRRLARLARLTGVARCNTPVVRASLVGETRSPRRVSPNVKRRTECRVRASRADPEWRRDSRTTTSCARRHVDESRASALVHRRVDSDRMDNYRHMTRAHGAASTSDPERRGSLRAGCDRSMLERDLTKRPKRPRVRASVNLYRAHQSAINLALT
jgi:hypothetical protein